MRYLFANWKAQLRYTQAIALAELLSEASVSEGDVLAAFPDALHVKDVSEILGREKVGVQNMAPVSFGAHTGQCAGGEVVQYAAYILIGHSEMRAAGETDSVVAAKSQVAVENGLFPVVCIGETADERDGDLTIDRLTKQVEALMGIEGSFIIAYEPVWAIGTGNVPSMQDIESAIVVIREVAGSVGVQVSSVLYGGSVSAETASDILSVPGVDGLLVGGASQKEESLKSLVTVCFPKALK